MASSSFHFSVLTQERKHQGDGENYLGENYNLTSHFINKSLLNCFFWFFESSKWMFISMPVFCHFCGMLLTVKANNSEWPTERKVFGVQWGGLLLVIVTEHMGSCWARKSRWFAASKIYISLFQSAVKSLWEHLQHPVKRRKTSEILSSNLPKPRNWYLKASQPLRPQVSNSLQTSWAVALWYVCLPHARLQGLRKDS